MTFTNLLFIFGFLPVSLLACCRIRNIRIQNVVLLVLSLLFYAWGNPAQLLLMIILILWTYFGGLQLENHRQDPWRRQQLILAGIVGVEIAVLAVYKYLNTWLVGLGQAPLDLILPVGLSFYTFSLLSYIGDVYMEAVPAERNILDLSLYCAFFGKVNMGPISDYEQFIPQIRNRVMDRPHFFDGVQLFLRGLARKVILADQFSLIFTQLAGNASLPGAWLSSLAYTFQLYYDFSGYSDMAIGIGKMFGFDIPENFNYPYIATNVQDFWRRWHISLSSWFRDYVYIPLGGSKVDNAKYIRNILVVWLLTGIWHGPNLTFIVWGLYYGLLILAHKFFLKPYMEKLPRPVQILLTFLMANVGWIFFSSPDIGQAFARLGQLIGIGAGGSARPALFMLSSYWLLYLLGFLFAAPAWPRLRRWILLRFKDEGVTIMLVLEVILFVICLAFIVSGTSRTFLYAAF